MSRLNDLIRQVFSKDPSLGLDLQREVTATLKDRRTFGLNFERHVPEVVELPGRRVRRGDKVRVLPRRGQLPKKSDEKVWLVRALERNGTAKTAQLVAQTNEIDTASTSVEDLVVVAEFRDPIYPGLVSTGKVERGGEKPYHVVINAENYYALQLLLFTHRGKVDCIYIDPPYNTGARDWKYNNDYVEADDHYRHSKWLAFMERRLKIAKELLNPDCSVLFVTIDEKEVHRLALLLDQIFPPESIQMITSVISAKGAVRTGQFSRVEEHIFVVAIGDAVATPWTRNMLDDPKVAKASSEVDWLGLRRREPTSVRGARRNQFYAIFVDKETGNIHSVGQALADDVDRSEVNAPEGTVAIWPLKPGGKEMLWGLTPDVLRKNWEDGFVRVNRWNPDKASGTVQYLPTGTIAKIRSGHIRVIGRSEDGSVLCETDGGPSTTPPKRVWNMASHNAELGGTNLLSSLLPDRRFPFPKSVYAVEDLLRFYLAGSLDATVVDFFAGSGTTAHAVMRLNAQDGGRRKSILVTNNEVAAGEQATMRKAKLRPGDCDWEARGICDYITKPRIQAAVTGLSPDGNEIPGSYKFTDEAPIVDGFQENAEFFTLTYEAQLSVVSNREFERIAPLLWMRAGAKGSRIQELPTGWAVVEHYGVLADFDHAAEFLREVEKCSTLVIVFLLTDDDWLFESICRSLPEGVEPVRLYDAYIRNFEIEAGRAAR